MLSHRWYNKCVRVIAVFAAAAFLWNQVIWAQEATGGAIPGASSEETRYMTPQEAENQWTILRNLINHKQAIQDFIDGREEPRDEPQEDPIDKAAKDPGEPVTKNTFTIVTEDGTTVQYTGGKISGLKTPDGMVAENLLLDESGGVADADITYADGVSIVIRDGKVREGVDAEGMRSNYDSEGLLISVEYPNGETSCSETCIEGNKYYIEDGNVTSVLFADGTLLQDFQLDWEGNIARGIAEAPDGEKTVIVGGMLVKKEYADGTVIDYAYTVNPETGEVISCRVTLSRYGSSLEYIYKRDPVTGDITLVPDKT